MRVLSIVMLVLWVCSAAAAEDALAQEDTATLWAAFSPAGTLRWCGTCKSRLCHDVVFLGSPK